jgi:hypothetical protein
LLSDTGVIITRKSAAAVAEVQGARLETLDVGKQVLLAVKPLQTTSLAGRNALIVVSVFPPCAMCYKKLNGE